MVRDVSTVPCSLNEALLETVGKIWAGTHNVPISHLHLCIGLHLQLHRESKLLFVIAKSLCEPLLLSGFKPVEICMYVGKK